MSDQLIKASETAWETPDTPIDRAILDEVLYGMDQGEFRVATPPAEPGGEWVVNDWLMKAILLYFRVAEMIAQEIGPYEYHDKIPLKRHLDRAGVRLVPPGHVRFGAHIEAGCVIMPSYINIGSYIGSGTMVDTWATVGSCAQIGKDVHISGGVGIGGVLEPPGKRPVIVEDGAFVGSRCVLVEGVRIGREAVLGANVVLTASMPIIDVTGPKERVFRGAVPPRSVVIPGMRPRRFPSGLYGVACALIIGQRKESTDRKTSLNRVLREFAIPV